MVLSQETKQGQEPSQAGNLGNKHLNLTLPLTSAWAPRWPNLVGSQRTTECVACSQSAGAEHGVDLEANGRWGYAEQQVHAWGPVLVSWPCRSKVSQTRWLYTA